MPYWDDRSTYGYYTVVRAWLKMLSASGNSESILDVGSHTTPVASWGHFWHRYSVDLEHSPKLHTVESFIADFLTWEPPVEHFDVITCLQVLEHLDDETLKKFVAKLFDLGDHLIVSVPYEWPAGLEADHKQDPISLTKFVQIMGRAPDEKVIVFDTKHLRLVALYINI